MDAYRSGARGRTTAGVEFHDAFFAPDRTPFTFEGPTAITTTPVLESLLTHLARTDFGDGTMDDRAFAGITLQMHSVQVVAGDGIGFNW